MRARRFFAAAVNADLCTKSSTARVWSIAFFTLSSALGCAGGGPPACGEAPAKVVYGQDDRRDPRDYPVDAPAYAWARSAAMLVRTSDLRRVQGTGFVLASTQTFGESMRESGTPLCPEEPFQDQPIFAGTCSAFLVAPDAVVTAGHCVSPSDPCRGIAFAFGVGYDRRDRDPSRLAEDDVYLCKEVPVRVVTPGGVDHALVKLDRPVVGRAPLHLRRTGKVADDEELILIGNPMGLPMKIAAHGKVLDNTPPHFFTAGVDGYGGGSGSAVIGARSGLVEGILVRGEEDFVRRDGCWVSRVCPDVGARCRGEDVARATEIAADLGG